MPGRRCVLLASLVLLTGCGGSASSATDPADGITPPGAKIGPPTDRQVELPADASRSARRGVEVFAQSGCEACHRLGENGNDGPGPRLDGIGVRLSTAELERTLVKPTAPMPSFGKLKEERPGQFDDLVAFLAVLR